MFAAQVKITEALQRRIDQLERRLEEREAHVAELADRNANHQVTIRIMHARLQRLES